MIVYHGSIDAITTPDINHSFRNLDFGKGFYVTTVLEQAQRWSKRKALLTNASQAFISEYEIADSFQELNVLKFDENLDEWIDFVCSCRDGSDIYKRYDIIMGKVADDKVYRVIDMYRKGIWDKDRALSEIKIYDTYDQIAFVSQKAIDKCLKYKACMEVQL